MAQIISASGELVITVTYDATGLASATIRDYPVLGWIVDETSASLPVPVITGTLPEPPDTAPVVSPPWCLLDGAGINFPDGGRIGHLADFFTWLATNGGAQRKLAATFVSRHLVKMWVSWSRSKPELVQESVA